MRARGVWRSVPKPLLAWRGSPLGLSRARYRPAVSRGPHRPPANLGEQVILVMHQLLLEPTDAEGTVAEWIVPAEDLIDNRADVLEVLT